jgi:rhodanese-related sulfurtransferase
MRRLFLKATLGWLSAWLLRAQDDAARKIRQFTTEELKELVDSGKKFLFLDVREPKELEELGTIKGYVNIPLSQIESRLDEIPKNAVIVTA